MGRGRPRKYANKKKGSHNPHKPRDENVAAGDAHVLTIVDYGNFKMEAYYAAQGLHSHYWAEEEEIENENASGGSAVLKPCTTLEEFQQERMKWRNAVASVLPASFRIGTDVPEGLKLSLEAQLKQLLAEAAAAESTAATATATTTMEEGDGDDAASVHETTTNETVGGDEAMKLEEEEAKSSEEKGELNSTDAAAAGFVVKRTSRQRKTEPTGEVFMKPLEFLPYAYQVNLDRATIRKHPALAKLKEWLVQKTASGHVSRQETVSMIPPVVLNVSPTDMVLDMCAAPGSKTAQLLEALNESGCLVANDANPQRAYMLVHQLRRIMHSKPVVLVTACNAQFFPSSAGKGGSGGSSLLLPQFDKILADVPCTGDGTSRKNLGVWKKWSQQAALGLHQLQIDIAWKGAAQLLQTGGYLCYSTCSFNPIENEAVVAELLRKADGQLELVPVTLPGFRTRPGLSHWHVFSERHSRREIKNKRNKNNAKMQARRKEWEEKHRLAQAQAQAQQQTEKEEQDPEAQVEENSKDKDTVLQDDNVTSQENETNHKDNGTNGKNQNDKKSTTTIEQEEEEDEETIVRRKYDPTSMDEAALIQWAEESGLRRYSTPEEVPKPMQRKVVPSCFPPTSQDERDKFHLERCLRCVPHDNDTGGFFVALLRKVGPISHKDKCMLKAKEQGVNNKDENAKEEEDVVVDRDVKRIKMESTQTNMDVESTAAKEDSESKPQNDGSGETKMDVEKELEKDNVKDEGVQEDAEKDDEQDDDNVEVDDDDDDDDDLDGLDEDNKPIKGKGPLVAGIGKGGRGTKQRNQSLLLMEGNSELNADDFIPVADEILDPLIEFYGLRQSLGFKKELYMTRFCGDVKVIYYIAPSVKKLIDLGIQKRVQVINTGLKGFVRNNRDSDATHRVAQEGVHFLAPYMTKRKVTACWDDFDKCLTTQNKSLNEFSTTFRDTVLPITDGSFVVVLEGFEEQHDRKMVVAMWRCRGENITGLISKIEIEAMRSKLKAIEEERAQVAQQAA